MLFCRTLLKGHIVRGSFPEVFCKSGIFLKFTELIGKRLCWGLFFNKVYTDISLCILHIFKNTFFYRTPKVAASVYVMTFWVQWYFPWVTAPRTITSHEITLGTLPLNNPLWTTTPENCSSTIPPLENCEKCFELRHFESEFHLSEASITTGDPGGGDIVYSFGHFVPFLICAVLLSHEIKTIFFFALLKSYS